MPRVVGSRNGGGETTPGEGTATASGLGKGARNSASGVNPGGHEGRVRGTGDGSSSEW